MNIILKESEPNAYEALYVKDLVNYMETSKMIGIYHFNAIGTRNYRKAWQNARRLQMNLETYEPVMVKGALDGTRWENLLFFLKGTNPKDGQRFAFCPEILPKSLLQFEKKVPEAYLMGNYVYLEMDFNWSLLDGSIYRVSHQYGNTFELNFLFLKPLNYVKK